MLLLHSESFPHYGLDRVFQIAKDAGFDGVEISVDQNFDSQNPEYLKTLEQRYKLPIRAFSLPLEKEEKYFEAFQKTVREFPGATMNLCPSKSLSFGYKRWVQNIVPKLSKKYNLPFLRKNAPFKMTLGLIPQHTENSLYTLREAGDVCLDLSALWETKEDVMRAANFLGTNLKHVLLSNVHRNIPYAPIMVGALPLESFLTKLAQKNFRGDFTLRVDGKLLGEGDDEKVMKVLAESKSFFDEYFTNIQKPGRVIA